MTADRPFWQNLRKMRPQYLSVDDADEGTSLVFSPALKPCDPTIAGEPGLPKPVLLRAYDNQVWIHSRGARLIRIMSEFMETGDRLKASNVYATILFCGSSKIGPPDSIAKESNTGKISVNKNLSQYYPKVVELSRLITEWAQTEEAKESVKKNIQVMPFYSDQSFPRPTAASSGLLVCSGGGAGIMEAANKGAAMISRSSSMGMGISIPDGLHVNDYVDKKLFFTYHYFFTRKFWMAYIALGIVAAPGGVGTLDELMEFLNLKHTGSIFRSDSNSFIRPPR